MLINFFKQNSSLKTGLGSYSLIKGGASSFSTPDDRVSKKVKN